MTRWVLISSLVLAGFLGATTSVSAARRAAPPTTAPASGAANSNDIDWDRAQKLIQQSKHGEKLSPEDQAFLDRAKEVHAQGGRRGKSSRPATQPAAGETDVARQSVGFTPLTDFTSDQKYKGVDGGLYGNGRNDPPESQAKAAQAADAQIQPLDAKGKPSPDGKIVLLSIGMSNTTREFAAFKAAADKDPFKSPKLVIVDGAQGGMDAVAWTQGTHQSGTNDVWNVAEKRIQSAGVTREQVQVIWIKQAIARPAPRGEFPGHVKALQDEIETILQLARRQYPNLRIAYLSSRTYGGYGHGNLNPEPYAYEGAFAMRGVIEDQMRGDANLNADPAKGEVKAPVVLWGPYLWADGTKGRKLDDLIWNREDFVHDGTHPSESGKAKVVQLLLNFFKSDPTAKTWFVKSETPQAELKS